MKISASSKRRSKRSRARKRRFALFAIVVAITLTAIVAFVRTRAPQPRVVADVPAVRAGAAPAAPWTESERKQLVRTLQSTFANVKSARGSYSLVVEDANGAVLYDDGGDSGVIPASVQKLVVADTALHLLGPTYRFRTILAAPVAVRSDGVLDGNLWLVGSGDPSFRSDDLRGGIASLYAQGLRELGGGVAVDPTVVRGEEINPHWRADDANEDYQTATSGVSLDGDTVEFRVYGTQPGEAARVVAVPSSGDLRVYGTIATGGGDDVIIAAMPERNTFRLSGSIPAGVEEKFWLPVHDIPRYAGAVISRMLEQTGIRADRPASVSPAPLDSIALWQHRSAPLSEIVKHMLYLSDNHFAEQLLRAVGREGGTGPTDQGGVSAEIAYLRSRSIPVEHLRIVDGSGLAEANRISARTLAGILSDAQLRDRGAELYPLLPAGGRDGTLKHYHFGAAAGRVRAKTGHLSDADSLAGYLDTDHHGRIAFAFMTDDSPGDPDTAYIHALDALVKM